MHRSVLCIIAGATLSLCVSAYGQDRSEASDGRIKMINPKLNSRPPANSFHDPNAPVELSPPRSNVGPAVPIRTETIRREQPDEPIPRTPFEGIVVQLSAQKTESEARASFDILKGKYPTILGPHQPLFRRAEIKGHGIFYVVAVGPFQSTGQANDFCATLKDAGGICMVRKDWP